MSKTGRITGDQTQEVLPKNLQRVVDAFERRLVFQGNHDTIFVVLAAYVASRIGGPDPLWLQVVDATGGGKTDIILSLEESDGVHSVSTLTEAGLLSRTSGGTKEVGLLPTIGNSPALVVAKDFTTILTMHPSQARSLLGAMREAYDGRFNRQISGMEQPLKWRGRRFGFLGGVTEAIDKAHVAMSINGQRFVLWRSPDLDVDEAMDAVLERDDADEDSQVNLAAVVRKFVDRLDIPTSLAVLSDEEKRRLKAIAQLVSHARTGVDYDVKTREVSMVFKHERPMRLVSQLRRLYTALLVIGLTHRHAMRITVKAARDCIPRHRMTALMPLVELNDQVEQEPGRGWITTKMINTWLTGLKSKRPTLHVPSYTHLRFALTELVALGVIEQELERVAPYDKCQYRLTEEARDWVQTYRDG